VDIRIFTTSIGGALAATIFLHAAGGVAAEAEKKPTLRDEILLLEVSGFSFALRGELEDRYAITPIGENEKRLATTKINPLPRPENDPLQDFFAGKEPRPSTWAEAEQGCGKLNWGGASWRLPAVSEIRKITDLGLDVFVEHQNHPSGLAGNYRENFYRGGQFRYIWTKDRDEKLPEGLHVGFNPVTGTAVSHSEEKPMSVICVADLNIDTVNVSMSKGAGQ